MIFILKGMYELLEGQFLVSPFLPSGDNDSRLRTSSAPTYSGMFMNGYITHLCWPLKVGPELHNKTCKTGDPHYNSDSNSNLLSDVDQQY